MKILVKFPTRERPLQFLKVLNLLGQNKNVEILATIDKDDSTMANFENDSITIDIGYSDSKIHACNKGVDNYKKDWDIVVLVSDDMIPQTNDWHHIIRKDMKREFPDTDGVLWYSDGYQNRIDTLCILGRKYYDRFNYIYNPEYHSLFCDNEFTEVAESMGKLYKSERCLFKHEHFANNPTTKRDALYDRNEALFNIDKQTFERRKKEGFPITEKELG